MTAIEFNKLRYDHYSKTGGREPLGLTDEEITDSLDLLDDGRRIGSATFTRCTFRSPLFVKQASGYGALAFEGCIFQEDVQFERIKTVVSWPGSSFEKSLIIDGAQGELTIAGFSIAGQLRIAGNYDLHLILKDINGTAEPGQRGNLYFSSGTCKDVDIRHCQFGDVDIGNSRKYNGIINLDQVRANIVCVMHLEIGNWLRIRESTIHELKIDNLPGEHRFIQLTNNVVTNLSVACHQLDQLKMEAGRIDSARFWGDVPKNTIIEVRSATFQDLIFDELYIEGRVAFRGITVPQGGYLSILGSTLGNCFFIKCELSKAVLKFDNSKISEIFAAETDFPEEVFDRVQRNRKQGRLVFGQLHTAFDKQGDTIRSLEYHAREIAEHYSDIPSFWIRFPRPHFTKLSLWLNKVSNDFGRDWGRGAAFSIGVGLLSFTWLAWTTQAYSFHGHWQWDPWLIPSFFRFMNPLRFFDLEGLFTLHGKPLDLTLTSWSYFADFVGRLFLAYGYYQTIQAFRRYGRK